MTHLHAHFCHTPTSVAVFAAQLNGLPFSFTAHAKDIYTSEPDQLRRKIQLARFVVTCTRYNARYLSQLADRNTPIHTVYHGIDLNLFSFGPSSPVAPPYRIFSIGRMVPKKGYDDLLNALETAAQVLHRHRRLGQAAKAELEELADKIASTRAARTSTVTAGGASARAAASARARTGASSITH